MQLKSYPYLQGRFELDTKELQSMDVFNIGRDEIRVATTSHFEPSLAYRIDSKSSSVIFSGDTEPCEGIKKLIGDNVGVLIHECSSISKVSGHTNPKTLARFIKGLPVYKLILTHFSPEVESNMENIKDIVSTAFNGEIIFAEDLMKLEV
jgi:ribonuclease BN (tRNA processing enzyme)